MRLEQIGVQKTLDGETGPVYELPDLALDEEKPNGEECHQLSEFVEEREDE